jgi:hypothetical protein
MDISLPLLWLAESFCSVLVDHFLLLERLILFMTRLFSAARGSLFVAS